MFSLLTLLFSSLTFALKLHCVTSPDCHHDKSWSFSSFCCLLAVYAVPVHVLLKAHASHNLVGKKYPRPYSSRIRPWIRYNFTNAQFIHDNCMATSSTKVYGWKMLPNSKFVWRHRLGNIHCGRNAEIWAKIECYKCEGNSVCLASTLKLLKRCKSNMLHR